MSKVIYADWSCPAGPAELVDYLVDSDHAEEVDYEDFSEAVDVSTAPLDETQFEILATDWHVTWLRTRLPSGKEAWVMQHSGIEHLFTEGGDFDHEREARLAEVWAESQ
jgi:hypothetical protein